MTWHSCVLAKHTKGELIKKSLLVLLSTSTLTLTSCNFVPKGFVHDNELPFYMDYINNDYCLPNVSMELYVGFCYLCSYSVGVKDTLEKIIYLNVTKEDKFNIEFDNNSIILKVIPLKDYADDAFEFDIVESFGNYYIKYHSSIFVTIPEKVFSKDVGYFSIAFVTKDTKDNSISRAGTGLSFVYTKKSNNIISIES